MGLFNNLFGSKNQLKSENASVEVQIPDDVKNLTSRDQYKDSVFFYNFLQRIKPFSERTLNGFNDAKKIIMQ